MSNNLMDLEGNESEEEEVLRELDLYLLLENKNQEIDENTSKKDSNYLYLTQYTTKPAYSEHPPLSSIKFKTKVEKLDVSFPYPALMEQEITGSYNSKQNVSNFNQTMEGKNVSSKLPLAMGFISAEKLVLVSVDGVIQMRPSYNYFSKTRIETVEDLNDDDFIDDDYLEGETKGKKKNGSSSATGDEPVAIQLRRKENNGASTASSSSRSQTYSQILQKELMDPWIKLKCYGPGSEESDVIFDNYVNKLSSI